MRIGSILLDFNDNYLVDNRLPARPEWDKGWLKYLCEAASGITYSPSTGKDLPDWAKKPSGDWDLNLGIATLEDQPDLLLVSRSYTAGLNGKVFRLDNWERVPVEVWKRREDA